MSTLTSILSRLPTIARNRYADAWWIATANRVLGDIERYSDQSGQIIEVPLLTVENFIEYAIPSTIRRVVRLRTVLDGNVSTYRLAHGMVPYRIIGSKIRLNALPVSSDDSDISGSVANASSTNHEIRSGVLSTSLTTADESLSRLVKLTHTTGGAIEYRIISNSAITSSVDHASAAISGVTSQLIFTCSTITGAGTNYYKNYVATVTFAATGTTETRTISAYTSASGIFTVSAAFTQTLTTNDHVVLTCGIVQPNGLFDTVPVLDDTFLITSNFLILEGFKFLTRFTAVGDTVPLELMFEKVLEDGLRYYAEIQTDENSKSASIWDRQYRISMKEYREYYRRPIGDQAQVQVDDGWTSL